MVFARPLPVIPAKAGSREQYGMIELFGSGFPLWWE